MEVYVVAGGEGSGRTATALNLTVALRGAGRYAAVLDADLSGNVASLLGVTFDTTMGDAVAGDASVRAATIECELSADDLPADDLADYRDALAVDRTGFRTAAVEGSDPVTAEDEPDTDMVPVVGGWHDRADHLSADAEALSYALGDLSMAYEVLVVDAGNGPAAESPLLDEATGVLAVTTPDRAACEAAKEDATACARARDDVQVVGVVVNRAGEDTSVSEMTDLVGAKAFGVVPADARTAALEPVAFTLPGSPAAAAYERLADAVLDWDGTSGLLGPTPANRRDGPAGSDVATDGDGSEPDEEGSGGFLSRFLGG
jgi:MinD-like ATPase involved in chromosome partitioning or flagellar assembly